MEFKKIILGIVEFIPDALTTALGLFSNFINVFFKNSKIDAITDTLLEAFSKYRNGND